MSRRIVLNLCVFVGVFLVMCGWAVRNVVTIDALERPYELGVDLPAASGIATDSEVAYLGVNIGRVGHVALVDGGVEATLKIDDDRRIPRGSVARIFRKSAIGEPYVDFQPPEGFDAEAAGDDAFYEPGDTVPIEDTSTPIEFSELLRSASDLLSTIEPERAGTLLHELALALDGRGEDLRDLTEAGDRLAATFAERTDAFDRLLVNGARLTEVFADHRGALGQTLTDLAALGDSLRNAAGDTRVLLDRGTALLAEVGDLVADARPSLDCVLDDVVALGAMTADPERLAGLATHLDIGPAAYARLYSTRDVEADGPWVRVNLQVHLGSPAKQHAPPLALPAVPAPAPCAAVQARSTTPAVAADFVPAEVVGGAGTGATPARAAAVAAGVLATALPVTAVAVHRRRSTDAH